MVGSLMKKVKRSRNIYDDAITLENIQSMWHVIRITCKNKKELFYFSLNLNTNLYSIWKSLKDKTYTPSKYRTFMIFEPKPRLVMSQTITDKIVNHFVANYYLIPYLESTLIDSNVATRKGRGSSYAMFLVKKYFNKIAINEPEKEIYCLKVDIKKYFYSIDHNVLLDMLRKKIKDVNVINLIKTIIEETNSDYVNYNIDLYNKKYNVDIPYYKKGVGLSIGAMSSQFLAIYFLNDLDHFIKEKLKCKYYVRYMDDLLILDTNKKKLKNIFKIIANEVRSINLDINKKSNIYRSSNGFTFLGYTYKFYNNKLYIGCKKKTFVRINRKLKALYKHDKIKYLKSIASYNGYFRIKDESRSWKVNSKKIYELYKEKYGKCLVIVKEGIFYKTYLEDAKIVWYLFSYKYTNDMVSFGNNSYDKVIAKLKSSNISFVIADKQKELLSYFDDNLFYESYFKLAEKSFEKNKKENFILEQVKEIVQLYPDCYDLIENDLKNLRDELEKRCYKV